MTVNATTILAPELGAGFHSEEALAQRARVICQTPADLEVFLDRVAADVERRFGTPEGPQADKLFSEPARDLLDTIEGWQDDPAGAWAEVLTLGEPC